MNRRKQNIGKQKIIFLLIFTILFLSGCMDRQNQSVQVMDTAEYFGTIITITLYGEDEKLLKSSIEQAFDECKRLESICSAKSPDSELYKLNQTAAESAVTVSEELFNLIEKGLYYYELSDGNLDISIGKLIDLWGIGTDHPQIPTDAERTALLELNGCKNIILDKNKKTIQYTNPLVQIDLGAIAKGYAADKIKNFLVEKKHIKSGILNLGGNVMTIGEKIDGSAWKVGLTNPQNIGELYGVMLVKDHCVVTSGNYEKYFIEDEKKYHHILNPTTGYPAESGIISATVIGDNATLCDALSTACFIIGIEKALELIEGLDEVECILIDEAMQYHVSSGMWKYNFTVTS